MVESNQEGKKQEKFSEDYSLRKKYIQQRWKWRGRFRVNGTILFLPPMFVQMKSCFGNTKEIGRRVPGNFSYFFSAMLRGPCCYTVIRRNTDYEHQNIHKHS